MSFWALPSRLRRGTPFLCSLSRRIPARVMTNDRVLSGRHLCHGRREPGRIAQVLMKGASQRAIVRTRRDPSVTKGIKSLVSLLAGMIQAKMPRISGRESINPWWNVALCVGEKKAKERCEGGVSQVEIANNAAHNWKMRSRLRETVVTLSSWKSEQRRAPKMNRCFHRGTLYSVSRGKHTASIN